MAIDQHGDEVLHSIYGRKFGIDKGGHAAGLAGVRMPYEASTAASTLTSYGMSVLSGSTASHTLGAPPAIGVTKTIINASTISTATMTIVRNDSSVTFLGSSTGSTNGVGLTLVGNAAVSLVGISSAAWAPFGTATFATTAQGYVLISTSS